MYSATYSPDDDKLRLYALSRLDPETYARVKAAGFRWAPKQELFVAPCWTPAREDLLIELAGEIDDEDKDLTTRTEERADRFEEYADNRKADHDAAQKRVQQICDGIPFGQPILVGHHSEKHARADQKRIDQGMRKAVNMWKLSKHWQERAIAARAHAKYKEQPGVRHRRIKTLEAEQRKTERNKIETQKAASYWRLSLTLEQAVALASHAFDYDLQKGLKSGAVTLAEAVEKRVASCERAVSHYDRWIEHYANRVAYERAMLEESTGTADLSTRWDFKPGGKVLTSRDGVEWLTILRVNKAAGVVSSLTTTAPRVVHWTGQWKYGVEKIVDYQPPTEEVAAAVAKATKLPPLCNYPGEGFFEMTEAEWKQLMKRKWSDFPYVKTAAPSAVSSRHRYRQKPIGMMKSQQVFITDAKRVDPPRPQEEDKP